MNGPFHVKHRFTGEKKWSFLTSSGGTSYQRIHAAWFDTKEYAFLLINANKEDPDNAGFTWKVVDSKGKEVKE